MLKALFCTSPNTSTGSEAFDLEIAADKAANCRSELAVGLRCSLNLMVCSRAPLDEVVFSSVFSYEVLGVTCFVLFSKTVEKEGSGHQ